MDQIVQELFWARVDRNGKQVPHMQTRCWAWLGTRTNGYGSVPTGVPKKWMYAHRVSFALHKGSPKGLVCHECDNRECCNPEHLYEGDYKSNMEDVVARNKNPDLFNRKRTPALVKRAMNLKEEGWTYRAIGKELGVSDVSARHWIQHGLSQLVTSRVARL